MDCHLQAIKSQVLKEIIPMLQSQKQDLKSEIDKLDRDRKRDQKAISLEIHSLKQKLQGRENSSMGNAVKFMEKKYQEQIQAINTLFENVTLLSSSMQMKQIPNSKQGIKSTQQLSSNNFAEQNKEKSIVSLQSKHLDKFKIECNERIQKISNTYQWHQLLGNIPIVQKPTNKFIILNSMRKTRIGIIDRKYINDKDSFEQKRSRCIFCEFDNLMISNHIMIYAEGKVKLNQVRNTPTIHNFIDLTNKNPTPIFPNAFSPFSPSSLQNLGSLSSFQPFSSFSTKSAVIIMKVEGNTIYWYEDQIVKAILTTSIIQESSMNWVPFIMMYGGDKINWQ